MKKAASKTGWNMLPSKENLEDFLQNNNIERTWRNVKDFIRNEITRLRRTMAD